MHPDTVINPNAWAVGEIINIGLFATLYLSCLVLTLWKAVRNAQGRFYCIACAASIIIGTLIMVIAPFTSESNGEMPPQAGLGAWIMILGLLGSVAVFIWWRFVEPTTNNSK
ncbi:hypothetical protein [Shewanella livingstonensis]|uniref:Uncharacterized protein n=1 Tax=Shewanella livingstonensis TaxID=150120 RepID=A0A3G8LT35_9GAMM|nr:hypothetical protein [Shewanella livingstonensis]AZG72617.1 hypothetical protein EGC82_07425 [Shewanella livingstonensis]